jgi:phage shock protein PspC (stress-responsive transcriptional regulator)
MISTEEKLRFSMVCREIAANELCGEGIGTYSEKRLHKALKHFFCDDADCHEVRIKPDGSIGKKGDSGRGGYIADIFRERVPSPMMVITYTTVLATMQQIGSAEMFGEANRPLNNAEQSNVGQKSTRRFVRSIDDKAIAGVCGGIAEYFGIDSTLVRIIFVVGVIAGFSTGLLYFVLWLVTAKQSRTTTI